MGPQIASKSMKKRGCVADAFWERLGEPPAKKGRAILDPLWRPFSIKNQKRHPERRPKIDAEKVSGIDAQMVQT